MKQVKVKDVIIGEGVPKIVLPIVGKREQDIIKEAHHIVDSECDLVEWRIDFFEKVLQYDKVVEISHQLTKILKEKPLLITFRTKREGGELAITEQQYFELYQYIIAEGQLDLLDVELFMDNNQVQKLITQAHRKQIAIVMCNHDFTKTPEKVEIIRRLRLMQEKNADICKIAVMPKNSTDVLTLLEATNEMAKEYADRPIVTISMGSCGMISRLSGELFGSSMTFGSASKASAPGQIPVKELKKVLTLLSQ